MVTAANSISNRPAMVRPEGCGEIPASLTKVDNWVIWTWEWDDRGARGPGRRRGNQTVSTPARFRGPSFTAGVVTGRRTTGRPRMGPDKRACSREARQLKLTFGVIGRLKHDRETASVCVRRSHDSTAGQSSVGARSRSSREEMDRRLDGAGAIPATRQLSRGAETIGNSGAGDYAGS